MRDLMAVDLRRLRRMIALGAIGTGATAWLLRVAWVMRQSRLRRAKEGRGSLSLNGSRLNLMSKSGRKEIRKRVGVDKEFFNRLKRLIKIVVPRWRSTEAMLLLCQSGFLFTRTVISIAVARLDGAVVKALVNMDKQGFFVAIGLWLALALPATSVNAMIRYLQSRIALSFRQRLTQHVLEKYMSEDVYYKISQLDGRIQNADQLITQDISLFSESLSELYSNLAKPLLDLILFGSQLVKAIGWMGPLIMGAFYAVYGAVLPFVTPPFGELTAEMGRLEGRYRFGHSRLIQNSEEIAFYKGEHVEKGILLARFDELVNHIKSLIQKRIGFGIYEGWFLKYVSSATGYVICALPIFWPSLSGRPDTDTSESSTGRRTENYTRNRRYLLSLSDAITRILSSAKEIGELAGYSARVDGLLQVLSDVSRGKYVKTISAQNQSLVDAFTGGEVEFSDTGIEFQSVPIVTPNGDVLVKSLSVVIGPGMHLLITGPNGCGKSSLFRILGGLWPVLHGILRRPRPRDLFYIPQRPYLSTGTFRDQVIYPNTHQDMIAAGRSDNELLSILDQSHLRYVLNREGGWEAIADWKDVLSGGEKQRMGMARLFYHKPKYAILDECTSQVSIDVEGLLYTQATDLGISLLTVSHRPSLWKYHNFVLQFDGEGSIELIPLDVGHRMSLEEERANLVKKLADVPKLQSRLEEIMIALGDVPRSGSTENLTKLISLQPKDV